MFFRAREIGPEINQGVRQGRHFEAPRPKWEMPWNFFGPRVDYGRLPQREMFPSRQYAPQREYYPERHEKHGGSNWLPWVLGALGLGLATGNKQNPLGIIGDLFSGIFGGGRSEHDRDYEARAPREEAPRNSAPRNESFDDWQKAVLDKGSEAPDFRFVNPKCKQNIEEYNKTGNKQALAAAKADYAQGAVALAKKELGADTLTKEQFIAKEVESAKKELADLRQNHPGEVVTPEQAKERLDFAKTVAERSFKMLSRDGKNITSKDYSAFFALMDQDEQGGMNGVITASSINNFTTKLMDEHYQQELTEKVGKARNYFGL